VRTSENVQHTLTQAKASREWLRVGRQVSHLDRSLEAIDVLPSVVRHDDDEGVDVCDDLRRETPSVRGLEINGRIPIPQGQNPSAMALENNFVRKSASTASSSKMGVPRQGRRWPRQPWLLLVRRKHRKPGEWRQNVSKSRGQELRPRPCQAQS
jgi:hypothetical protein